MDLPVVDEGGGGLFSSALAKTAFAFTRNRNQHQTGVLNTHQHIILQEAAHRRIHDMTIKPRASETLKNCLF